MDTDWKEKNMDGITEKFNIFDLFIILISEVILFALFCASLHYRYYILLKEYGKEKIYFSSY